MPDQNYQNDLTSKYSLPTELPKLFKWGERQFDDGQKRRPSLYPRLGIAFYHGEHYIVQDPSDHRLRRYRSDPNDPNAPVKLSAPLIADRVDRVIAKLLKGLPVPEGRPATADPDDRDAAAVATKILAHEWERLGMEDKLAELYSWVVPAGWSYAQVTWNPKDGPPVAMLDQDIAVRLGNIEVDIVPFPELSFNADATSPRNARWAIRRFGLTCDEIYERWGVHVPDDGPGVMTLGDELIRVEEVRDGPSDARKIPVYQLWIRPGGHHDAPQGLVVQWAGNKVLGSGPKPFPYEHGRLPFVQYNYLPPQGTPYGRTIVKDCIPLQMEYNDAKSRMAHIRRTLLPYLTYPEGSIDANRVTVRGNHLPYKEGFGAAPTWDLPDGRWMQQFTDTMDRVMVELDQRFGLTEAATGQLAGTSAAATAISQAELATEPLHVPSRQLAIAVQETGWQMLELARQYWREKRVVRTWSKAGTLEVKRFSKANLREQLDVHVTKESALPRSKAGRTQLFIELFQQGLITDATIFTKLLELPPTDVLSLEFNRQVQKQERELGRMLDGEVQQVDPLSDDHEMHATVLINYMQEPDWEDLDDHVTEVIKSHLLAHMAIRGQQMTPPPEVAPEDPMSMNQGIAGGDVMGPGEQPPPTPGITDIAQLGGRTGQPGLVPGITADDEAAALGL